MRLKTILILLLLAAAGFAAERRVRVATYNIQFLSASDPQDRFDRLKRVIEQLDADVIGLEEIDNRAALEKVFDPSNWSLVIDDNSPGSQDVALAVRKPLSVLGLPTDLHAGDANFLFPSPSDDTFFPDRRDVLFVEIQVPESPGTFFVLVQHAKSRSGGRAATDFRREGAARKLIQVLEQQFDEKDYFLVGDMNDNPDDRSMNILETGDPNAPGLEEEVDGPFLINLGEILAKDGHVSEGLGGGDIVGDKINTVDSQSRTRNTQGRGTNQNTGKILFDQILIPVRMRDRYVQGSVKVFDSKVAVEGSTAAKTRASDHVPVFADFVFGSENPPPGGELKILSALPDPVGPDSGKEEVTLHNGTNASITLTGWKLRDRALNEISLSGSAPIGAGQDLTIRLPDSKMPLNNSGDSIALVDPSGTIRHQVSYTAAQVSPGAVITFP